MNFSSGYESEVRDDPKLLGNRGEVSISEWSRWWFDSRCEILMQKKKNLVR